MEWTLTVEGDPVTEWEREDGYATIRFRERADGTVVVRLDVMKQAPDGGRYEYETFDSRVDAADRVERWRAELS